MKLKFKIFRNVSSLERESNGIFNIFRKLANKLEKVNSEIIKETNKRYEDIAELEGQISERNGEIFELKQQEEKNNKLIDKLNKFLD